MARKRKEKVLSDDEFLATLTPAEKKLFDIFYDIGHIVVLAQAKASNCSESYIKQLEDEIEKECPIAKEVLEVKQEVLNNE